MGVRLIQTTQDLRDAARELGRPSGIGGAFVPTMGALHRGHEALIEHAARLSRDRGWRAGAGVSIFVNPTQFNDPRDFDRYPRTLGADLEACARAGASWVFVPDVRTMYPDASAAPIPPLPEVAINPRLEDAHRPGHFAGVAQVVLRLLRLVEPDAAIFGEKDWQQLAVVRAISASLAVEIVPHATIREPDGVAMSSRNVFLSPDERRRARAIHEALRAAGTEPDPQRAEAVMGRMLVEAGLEPEYAVVRDAATLSPIDSRGARGSARALIAARCGSVRLIDNAPWPAAPLTPPPGAPT